jgi:uncharacterized repeat protein (TIGR01451 family)
MAASLGWSSAGELTMVTAPTDPVVTSDEGDYSPYSTANLTAAGFGIGDEISFQVSIIDPATGLVSPLNADAPGASAWTVIEGANVDSYGTTYGSVTTSWYVDPYYADTTLLLTATDLNTGQVATEVFADAGGATQHLSITKTDGVSSVLVGSVDTYTITVSYSDNASPLHTVTVVKLSDTSVPGLINPVFTPTTGSYNATTGIWSGLSLTNGGSVTLQVTGTIPAGTTITDTAIVVGESSVAQGSTVVGGFVDSLNGTVEALNGVIQSGHTADFTATDTDTILTPGIGLQKLVSVDGGQTFVSAPTTSGEPTEMVGGPAPEFEFVITNNGNVGLTNVVLSDNPSLSGLGNIGSLAAGASDTIVATGTWAAGQNTDIASVVGTVIVNSATATPTASATGNYLGIAPATFDAHVYLDANGDSAQDSGDSNLSGITVSLLTGAGVPTGQTGTTDINGNVSFPGLTPGSYEVSVTPPPGDVATQQTNIQTPVTLAAGTTASAIEGVYAPAAFTVHVYTDANGNAVQDSGDSNLAGVPVLLLDGSGDYLGGPENTDSNGNVTFGGLAPGSYEVQVLPPIGDVVTQDTNVLTDNVLVSGQTASAVEGVYAPVTFTAHVYDDANANGVQDSGEDNLPGLTVDLENAGGTIVSVATTDANGNVSFSGLIPGSYEVTVTTPGGSEVTQQENIGTSVSLTPGFLGNALTSSGQTVDSIEGLFRPASFTTHVYYDANDNGTQDSGDTNLSGVTVTLLNGDGSQTGMSGTTDSNGDVTFTGLVPGSYEVSVTQPGGDVVTQSVNVNTPDTLNSGDTASAIEGLFAPAPAVTLVKTASTTPSNLADAGAVDGANQVVNYAITVTNTGNETLTGVVVTDPFTNATLPVGTLGIGQTATVETSYTASQSDIDLGNAIVNTATVTDDQRATANGSATTPVDQEHSLSIMKSVTSVNGVTGDPAVTGAGQVIDYSIVVANTGNETLTGVVVTDPFTNATLNIGTIGVGQSATVDTSYAAVQGDIDAGNALVNTASVTDSQGDIGSSTTSTAVDQDHSLSILKTASTTPSKPADAGAIDGANQVVNYAITVTNTGNETLTGVVVTDPLTHATLNIGTIGVGQTATVNTSYTASQNDIDLGNAIVNTASVTDSLGDTGSSTATTPVDQEPSVSIAKTVTSITNVNHDGLIDPGDIINYGIVVTNTGNETLNGVAVVDPLAGGTLVTGITLGVGQSDTIATSYTIQLSDILSGGIGTVINTATVTTGETSPQSASASQPVSSPASFTAHVYTDANANSTQDSGETNLAGVTVDLENAGGTIVSVATTDANGNVSFGDLVPGSYQVAVVKPAGDVVTQHSNVATPITLTPGGTASAIEGVYAPASFTAHVYTDANANSTQDTGETNLAGVTVDLENAGGTIVSVATTDVNGNVSFSGLVPGSYQAVVVKPAGDVVTQHTNVGVVDTLLSGQTTNAIEGVYAPASFTAHVYTDANANSTQDTGETNLAGVTVDLENAGGTIVSVATTDVNGNVSFSGLVPGSYQAVVVKPAGDVVTQHTNVGVVDALLSGQTTNAIEGVYAPVSVSGEVFLDKNDTGSLAGASGIAGVTVELENTGGTILATTTSGSGGLYSFTNLTPGSYQVQFVKPTGDVFSPTGGSSASLANQTTGTTPSFTLASGQTQANEDAGLYQPSGGSISVIKLPCQVVVGTCGEVTYTYDVTNTGTAPLTNVQITDNIGTAAHPDYVTPAPVTSGGFNVGDTNHNGVLNPGETWQYTNTIAESGDFSGGSSSCSHSVSGSDLSAGCTAWLNSSFTPTSCKNGATYTFQNISCTISGPGCSTTTVQVPNACVTFSSSCTQATTNYDPTQNCWVTTLPANCSPGNVFLSGLPFQVPSGGSLSGANVTWNIGQSANNCGSSSVSWQTGCTGYSSFSQNGCDGLNDYNQIGVKVCDNSGSYGDGGSENSGYGWDYGDSGGYCGGFTGWGGWWGSGSGWSGSSGDCAGTPENQYTGGYYGSCGGGYGGGCGGYGGWGYSSGGGSCGSDGNGSGSGTCSQGQLSDSPEADTVTVTASTLGSGFSLGDAANYAIIAFNPNNFKGSSNSPINGNVGIGSFCGSGSVQLASDKITGNLVTTGTKPTSTGGTVTGTISGNSSTLASDISTLQALSSSLGGETGTSLSLTSGMTINVSSGVLDSSGDYVFTVTKWANNITINGDGSHDVVLNISSSLTPVLDNVTLTGGLTPSEVLFNDLSSQQVQGTSGNVFNGTFLAPNAAFNVGGVTVNGHLFGGASGQNFQLLSNDVINNSSTIASAPAIGTLSASDSKEVQVLGPTSSITVNGSTPTGSLSALYGTAQRIELSYSPNNTVSLKQIQAGLASATGSNGDSMAFIEISNNSNPYATGASIYFEGEVTTGEKIYADATINQLTNTPVPAPNNHFSTTAGADTYAFVFNSQSDFQNHVAPIQTIAYNTSGSQAMHLGDQIASLTVIGYVGTTGGHLVS